MKLLIFGLGYSARHFVAEHGHALAQVTATVRAPARARQQARPGLEVLAFSSTGEDPLLAARLVEAEAVLVSVPPDATGDPVLGRFAGDLRRAAALRRIVYLSTVGVYGDHQGGWVDEATRCHPANDRGHWRLAAEQAWLDLGRESGKPVHILRLAGIYGLGQNALVNLKAGTARRIVKSGQVFNRIHVADIGRAILAALASGSGGIWNVSDDEPAPPQDVVTFAAGLLGLPPPPEIAFEDEVMSPMARSFYGECKRVSNRALKENLGVSLAYPTYREALVALAAAGDGGRPSS